jgi:hypothetical protein
MAKSHSRRASGRRSSAKNSKARGIGLTLALDQHARAQVAPARIGLLRCRHRFERGQRLAEILRRQRHAHAPFARRVVGQVGRQCLEPRKRVRRVARRAVDRERAQHAAALSGFEMEARFELRPLRFGQFAVAPGKALERERDRFAGARRIGPCARVIERLGWIAHCRCHALGRVAVGAIEQDGQRGNQSTGTGARGHIDAFPDHIGGQLAIIPGPSDGRIAGAGQGHRRQPERLEITLEVRRLAGCNPRLQRVALKFLAAR